MISLHHTKAERAAAIVKHLKTIADQLTWKLPDNRHQQLMLWSGGTHGRDQQVYLTRAIAEAAFRAWQEGLRQTAAQLRREAAQINLNVEGL